MGIPSLPPMGPQNSPGSPQGLGGPAGPMSFGTPPGGQPQNKPQGPSTDLFQSSGGGQSPLGPSMAPPPPGASSFSLLDTGAGGPV